MFLDKDKFGVVVESTPLVSVDLIAKNKHGQFLLGKRVNRPAKNFYFVPGGRILKNECIFDALKRVAVDELKVDVLNPEKLRFFGLYEHFYKDSFLSKDMSTHYVVLAYEIELEKDNVTLNLDQHSEYCWLTVEEIHTSNRVHQYTKNYFLQTHY